MAFGRCFVTVIVLALVGASAMTASAQAAVAGPGYAVSDWATGFGTGGAVGPVGLAVSATDIYVGDYATGRLYRFDQTAGGAVGDPGAEITTAPIPGALSGLAFDKDGRLYAALQSAGSVVELSLADGHIVRTLAGGLPCVTGLATDPISGDLFASGPCGSGIWRITGFTGLGPVVVTTYSVPANPAIDGIQFGPDGTLYASASNAIYRVDGTSSASPGVSSLITTITDGDGVAVAASSDLSQPPFLLANRNNGQITKIDLTVSPPVLTGVVSGGTRGDFVTVGNNGCLYATQSATVLKVTLADGTCNLAPVVPNQPPTAAFTFTPTSPTIADTVDFDGTASSDPDGTIVSYSWDFGDGHAGSGATPSHQYAAVGTYSVTLTVTDDDGASDSVTHDVVVSNRPPRCSSVAASPGSLWPPNHKLQVITLSGASDPDGDATTTTITGVTQDEPLNGTGDGDTSPDATAGPAPNKVNVRAERSGTGDGRVYRIAFTVTDAHGGSCTGTATVGVPHDQGKGSVAVDSAPASYNSFGP